MSIDWLLDLERSIDGGKTVYACSGVGRNQWVMGKTVEDLMPAAKRAANTKKIPIQIVRIIPKNDAITGDMYLVPTNIGEPGVRGEPSIEWKPIEAKEAAENMRDVRKGPSPFFGMQVETTVNPD
jgi:hypothetical protein